MLFEIHLTSLPLFEDVQLFLHRRVIIIILFIFTSLILKII